MNYRVHIPLHVRVMFPNLCPFTDVPSPSSKIKLKMTSTSTVLPIPGGVLNSYSQTALTFPAAKKTARLALGFELMIWISILAGIALCAWAAERDSDRLERMAFLFVPGGLIAALAFRILRSFLLRRVRIKKPWNGFVEIIFKSERYAREFAEQNRLTVSSN
jgi:hypothetical protein